MAVLQLRSVITQNIILFLNYNWRKRQRKIGQQIILSYLSQGYIIINNMEELRCAVQGETVILPTQALFQYSGQERYIQMQERFRVSASEEIFLSHTLLDQELSIIHRKFKQTIQMKEVREGHKEQGRVIYLLQPPHKPIIYSKYYQKYPQLNDFIFGREQWGRTYNCLRIASDLISRLHTRIIFNNISLQQDAFKLLILVQNITKESHFSSPLRKVSNPLWQKVVQYAKERPRYTIKDCGSRNGTFLMDCTANSAFLRPTEGYQFQNRQYTIYVNQMLQQKGEEVSRRIQAFKKNWAHQQFYNHHHSLKVVCEETLLASLPTLSTQVNAIHFQVDFSHQLKYFFWVVEDGEERCHNIGQGHSINISANLDRFSFDSSRHGSLVLNHGQWWLYPVVPAERIWVKLSAEREYELLTQRRWRVRLGHLNVIDLNFHNYS